MHKLIAIPVILLGLTGCAGVAFGVGQPVGALYTDASTGLGDTTTTNNLGKKKGEACATSILGLVTTGDASIRAAADAGNIKKVSVVDSSIMNILGLYAKYCTIVSGTGE